MVLTVKQGSTGSQMGFLFTRKVNYWSKNNVKRYTIKKDLTVTYPFSLVHLQIALTYLSGHS